MLLLLLLVFVFTRLIVEYALFGYLSDLFLLLLPKDIIFSLLQMAVALLFLLRQLLLLLLYLNFEDTCIFFFSLLSILYCISSWIPVMSLTNECTQLLGKQYYSMTLNAYSYTSSFESTRIDNYRWFTWRLNRCYVDLSIWFKEHLTIPKGYRYYYYYFYIW